MKAPKRPPKPKQNASDRKHIRNLVIVLGDQLDATSAAFDGFDAAQDVVWMAEVPWEATKVWTHKARIAVFFAAMRHFEVELRAAGLPVFYRRIEDVENAGSFGAELRNAIGRFRPGSLIVVEPGEWSVQQELQETSHETGVPLEIRPDRHFLCSREEFARYAAGKRQLRMEFFYREMRKITGVLMDGSQPVGGAWNYDAENRGSFGREGPGFVPAGHRFEPDEITREVLVTVEERFAKHPGNLQHFEWPVTAVQARMALQDFIRVRLPDFGRWQDAMWAGEPWLWHARLSVALNLKLLNPREVIEAAEQAFKDGHVPLASAEGFIRQILGWREFVHGIYWAFMPDYLERNALGAEEPLPHFYWTGDTQMNCLRHAIGQTLEYGYAHHIQRLMVTGLFALLLGVRPQSVHKWYLAIYVDAVEWVELPNTLGMSQYADGGVMGSKPYVATGKYIQRMSNYCEGCRFDPAKSTGENACPFTTLYWDFLLQHEPLLKHNQRMVMQLRNLQRLKPGQRELIYAAAARVREDCRQAGASVAEKLPAGT